MKLKETVSLRKNTKKDTACSRPTLDLILYRYTPSSGISLSRPTLGIGPTSIGKWHVVSVLQRFSGRAQFLVDLQFLVLVSWHRSLNGQGDSNPQPSIRWIFSVGSSWPVSSQQWDRPTRPKKCGMTLYRPSSCMIGHTSAFPSYDRPHKPW